jgi:ABC-2 type transport system ATP-binding protein
MIKAESLTRMYDDVIAVNQASFEICTGEIVGLLGHNGAGKTTIMKMITGYLEPTSGSITINGQDVWSNRLAVQKQLGYLPENCPLYADMSVMEYLDYAATLRGVAPERIPEQIKYAIGKTNLAEVGCRPINTLSRGFKQRLGVAQAILHSPSILILDEPTNGLDPSQILEMRALITELSHTATVVVSTHILQEVQAICNRVIIINSGKVVLDSDLGKLTATGRLQINTNSAPADCAPLIERIDGLSLASYQKMKDHYTYIIQSSKLDCSEAGAAVAQALVEHGYRIYTIRPLVRDLESIFADITSGVGIKKKPSAAGNPDEWEVVAGHAALAGAVASAETGRTHDE